MVVGTARLASAQYDPSLMFSPTINPNGVWSYGLETVPLGSTFNLLADPVPIPSAPGPFIDSWQSAPLGSFMGVFDNGTPVVQTVTTGASEISQFQPGMLAMNAGPNDEFALVQFTAPASGIYTIQGTFEGIDIAGTVSQVFLLENNVPVISGSVIGFGPGSDVPLGSGPLSLSAGDTLAYAVGGLSGNSMTALIGAQVSAAAIPEPSTYALLGLALVPLVVRGGLARKRKAAIV
ncbi:MAG: PEP-CTERM sorting domain-containing protein [Verrucomicrobiia bacterium]